MCVYILCVCVVSHGHLFATPWSVALQAPLSLGFPRLENWSGLPFPFPGDLPRPGVKSMSPALHVDSLPLSHWKNTYGLLLGRGTVLFHIYYV